MENADVIAEDGQQALQSPQDWWTVVRGSGYRWTLEQMDNGEEQRELEEVNLTILRESEIKFIETRAFHLCSGDENIGGVFLAPLVAAK